MPKAKTKARVYLTEEEKKILLPLLEEWSSQPDKKTRDAVISSKAIPKIQNLDLSKYGPEIISKDKAAKELWERRIQVCDSFNIHTTMSSSLSRPYTPGLKTISLSKTGPN